MPVIEQVTETSSIMVAFVGSTDFQPVVTFQLLAAVKFRCKTEFTPLMAGPIGEVDFSGSTTLNAFAHLDGEPNLFPEIDCIVDTSVEFLPTLRQYPLMRCDFGVTLEMRPSNAEPEVFPFDIIVDIVPPPSTLKTRKFVYELIINGLTTIHIKSFTYSEARNQIGNSLSFELADISQIEMIEAATSFRFRIGEVIGMSTTWKVLIDEGLIDSSHYSLTRQESAPITQFQFTNTSTLTEILGRGPNRDTVVYDPLKVPLAVTEFETLYDVSGNPYYTELVPISNMFLEDIFNYVFLTRLGFTEVIHNLPNFPVKRVDFSMTESYLSQVSSLIGTFEPLIFEYQNKIWILDTTCLLPPGFPPSIEFTVSDASNIQLSKKFEKIDAYYLGYTEDSGTFDFYTTRSETKFEESGSTSAGNFTRTLIVRSIREYRRISNPAVVIKSEIVSDRRQTSNYLGTTIGETLETFTYDFFGRQTGSERTQSALIPRPSDGVPTFEDIRYEVTEIRYRTDPFQPSRQVQQRVWTNVSGLMIVDNENLVLGEPFKQDYMVAYQSGNLLSTMELEFGLIKTIRETLEVKGPGVCQVETIVHDFILNTVTKELTEPKSGDFSVNALVGRQMKLLVPYDNTSLGLENPIIKRLNVGEIPLNDALNLVRRLLIRSHRGVCDATISLIGTYFYLRRGLPISVSDQDSNNLANCLVEGFSITGRHESLTTDIEGLKIG